MKKEKFRMLLGSTGMLPLAVVGLFFTTGCTPEDPPMPPGVYVPKKTAAEDTKPVMPVSSLDTKNVNTPGTAEFDTKPMPAVEPLPSAPAPRKTTTYKVVKGDSLWYISRKYGLTIDELASSNNLPANAKLRIGQKLTIPSIGKVSTKTYKSSSKKAGVKKTSRKAAAKAAAGKKSVSSKTSAEGVYTVKPGDNFSKIAKRNGIKVADLIAANPGVDSSRLKVGQKLNLKAGAGAATASKAVAKTSKKAAKTVAKAETATGASAPAATTANTSDKATDLDDMLKDIKDPDQSEKPAEAAPAANKPAADQASAKAVPAEPVSGDKDKFEDLPDGTVALTLGADTELSKFCAQYKVKEADLKMLNPSLPADGKLKKGMIIKMP